MTINKYDFLTLYNPITVHASSQKSYGTPYLLHLGLSKNQVALVWLAGPLSGLLIQPLVGAFSDRSTFYLGRRRPYIIIGGVFVCLSMIAIAYSKEWADIFVRWKEWEDSEHMVSIGNVEV